MKNSWKWLVSALLFSSVALAACQPAIDDGDVNGDVGGGGDDGSTKPQVDTTIHDAWDENRPNFGDFDYESSYTPKPPVALDTEYIVSIVEGSNVTFADGSTEKSIKVNSPLTMADFDFSAVDEARPVKGIAIVSGDTMQTMETAEATVIVGGESEIVPYFGAESGYTEMTLGSGKPDSGYNTDQVPGDFTTHTKQGGKVSLESNQLIRGGVNGYAQLGRVVKDTDLIHAGSAIRFDTRYASELTGDTVVEFTYNFENKSSKPLNLSFYQISASAEYKAAQNYYGYEGRHYRIDINLNAGESMTAKAQYLLGANGNALNYFVFNRDTEQLALGVALSYRIVSDATEASNPEQDSYNEAYKITAQYDLPTRFTLEDGTYNQNQVTGKKFTLPAVSAITNNTGKVFEGWKVTKADGTSAIVDAGTTVSYDQNVTITPNLADAAVITLQLPSGMTNNGYQPVLAVGDAFVLPTHDEINNTTSDRISGWYIVGDEDKTPIVEGETIVESSAVTIAPILEEKSYATISLQLPTGFTVSSEYNTEGVIGDDVTVPTTAQITNNTGRTLLGWYMQKDGALVKVIDSNDIALPSSGAVLYPLLSSDCNLIANSEKHAQGSTAAVADAGTAQPNTTRGAEDYYSYSTVFNTNDFTEEYRLTHAALSSGNWFRLNTQSNITGGFVSGKSYDFTYKLTNYGTTSISFTLWNCTNGWNITGSGNNTPSHKESKTVTIAAGETVTVSFNGFTYNINVAGGNFISLFVIDGTIDKLALGVRINLVETSNARAMRTVADSLPNGVSVDGCAPVLTAGDNIVQPTASQLTNTASDATQTLTTPTAKVASASAEIASNNKL